MSTGLIAIPKKGLLLPEKFYDPAFVTFKTHVGLAATKDGTIHFQNFTLSEADGKFSELVKMLQEEYGGPDVRLMFHFRQAPDLSPEDKQPYVLVNEGGKCLVAAALDGDFASYAQPKSPYSPEYHAVAEYLREKVTGEYERSKKDLGELIASLDHASFRKDIQNILVPSGVVTIMTAKGDTLSYLKGVDSHAEFKDFWTSKKLGYVDPAPPTAEAATAPAGESLMDKIKRQKREQAEAKEGHVTASKGSVPDVGKKDAPQPDIPAEQEKMPNLAKGKNIKWKIGDNRISPPEKQTEDQYRRWSNRNFGVVADNFRDFPDMPESMLLKDAPIRDGMLRRVVNAARDAIVGGNGDKTEDKTPKDVAVPQVIPPQQQKTSIDIIKNSTPGSAEELQAEEGKYEPASKQLGLPNGISDIIHARFKTIRALCANQQVAACIIAELCSQLRSRVKPPAADKKPASEAAPAEAVADKPMSLMEKIKAQKAEQQKQVA